MPNTKKENDAQKQAIAKIINTGSGDRGID